MLIMAIGRSHASGILRLSPFPHFPISPCFMWVSAGFHEGRLGDTYSPYTNQSSTYYSGL